MSTLMSLLVESAKKEGLAGAVKEGALNANMQNFTLANGAQLNLDSFAQGVQTDIANMAQLISKGVGI